MKLPFFKPADPRVQAYCEKSSVRWRASTPVADIPFVVVDVETTGFNIHNDRMLSMAALPVLGNRSSVGSLKSWLIYHPHAIVTPATEVHTILPSESSQGIAEEVALEELSQMMAGAIIVGHHIHFDAAMLNVAMHRHFHCGFKNQLVDTAVLAMQSIDAFRKTGYSNQKPPGLDEVCTHLGLPLWERHTAEGDTFGTAQLFLMLCARIQHKLGRPLTLRDLHPQRPPR